MTAPPKTSCAPSGALSAASKEEAARKFRLGCKMLRGGGKLDTPLPTKRRAESLIDWMVRARLAASPQAAVEALLEARELVKVRDELLAMPGLDL